MTFINLPAFKRAALVAVAMLAAGVGSQTSASAQDLEDVKIAISTRSLAALPFQMIDADRTIFAKHGLKFEEMLHLNQNNCLTALIGQQIDVCLHASTNGIDAVNNMADLKVIATTTPPITELVVSSALAKKLEISESDPIDARLKALKGLRISAIGMHEATLELMLQTVGMTVGTDIQAMKLSDAVAMKEGIRNGQIDGALWSIGALNDVVADGSGVRLISVPRGDFPAVVGVPLISVFVRSEWYEANKEKAGRIHDAIVDAIAMLKGNKDAAVAVKAKWHAELSQAIWDESYPEAVKVLYDDASVSPKDWATLLEMNAKMTKVDQSRAAFDTMVADIAQHK